ncbi:MAG TPA: shikimate dehydrogenase [Propionibacteriaceae bacterium]|nr:shikimate dehydrogenase [Propionibacteriaceae bacterium]
MTSPVDDGGRTRCAVLGSPIAHSLSPALHRAGYAELGLTGWSYDSYEVREPELTGFVERCDDRWRGLSLTMPLKVAALQLGEVDATAALVGAANTLVFDDRGRRVFNTDVGGLVSALRQAGTQKVERVGVLGAGATARSALASVASLGATTVTVVARDLGKAEQLRPLAEAVGVELITSAWTAPLPAADLVISTVTAGAVDDRADQIAESAPVIFDALYDPWPTALAAAAQRAGCTVVNGLDLLVGQAVLQIELMTGRSVRSEVLLAAGHAAVGTVPNR